jgi:iron complex transport system permease protein
MSSPSKVIDLDAIEAQYTQFVGKRYLFLLVLALITIALAGTAVTLGVIKLSIWQVYEAMLHNFLPDHFQATEEAQRVVWNIRLPRILFGLLAGMGLGIAGAVMQVVLKNPLASPYTLGISSAAGFGAAVAILLGQGFFGSYLIAGNAFIFALISSM